MTPKFILAKFPQKSLAAFLLAAGLLYAPNASAVLPGSLADATSYNVSIKSVELCTDSTCTDNFLVGASTRSFDIAAASAGADVGSYIDISGIPLFKTWSHVRVTLDPAFSITSTGLDNNGNSCGTDPTNTLAGHTALGAALASGPLEVGAQTLFVPNIDAFGSGIPLQADFDAFNVSKVDNGDVTVIFPLATPYTCKGIMPTIKVVFNTQDSVRFFDAGGGSTCRAYPMPPTVDITVTD